jgi:hypothetical protein
LSPLRSQAPYSPVWPISTNTFRPGPCDFTNLRWRSESDHRVEKENRFSFFPSPSLFLSLSLSALQFTQQIPPDLSFLISPFPFLRRRKTMKLDTSGLESFSAAVPSAVNGGAQLGADQLFGPASFELPAGCADVFLSSKSLLFTFSLYDLSCICSFLLLLSFFTTHCEVSYMPKAPPNPL